MEKGAMRIRNSAVTGLLFGVMIALIYLVTKLLGGTAAAEAAKQALLTGAVSGVVIGLYVRSFIKKQEAEFAPVRERLQSEGSVLAEAAADHDYGGERVAGRLFLMEDRLYFLSQTMNVLSHSCTVYISEILEVRLFKVVSFLPGGANGIELVKEDGTVQRFTLSGSASWAEKIEKLRRKD